MSVESIFRWRDGELEALDYCDMTESRIVAADSWLVTEGTALALGLHRDRFLAAAPGHADFWDAAVAAIPREGDWFPRVELHSPPRLVFRLRSAPVRTRSAVLATWTGTDPRTEPRVKGPDLASMLRIRTAVQAQGADEAVILTDDGYIVEGAYSALLWWRGEILCGPPETFNRVDSVTARSVLTLARALGIDTHEEAVTPRELDGTELWALSALHGIRIVTRWIDGPELAEKPGRLTQWRARLDALRRPLDPVAGA
ncbi:MAG: aminotransferase class IV [Salinibacterium sp.]|nr:aminotransferase class IV [Salinibacterium sp.]